MGNTEQIKIDELIFDCLTDGDEKDQLVIFLHGWPESAYMWKKLMADIAKKGYYCLAPNLRGYSKKACPAGKKHYSLDKLVKDVIDIANVKDKARFHLVGHDWGAAIGWRLVHDFNDRILSWTAVSVPHLQAFGRAIVLDQEQKKMSQYIKNFQLPLLPEMGIRKDDFKIFRKLWKHADEEEIAYNLSIFKNAKQLTASINYYRSNYKALKLAAQQQILGNISVPTLFIWGNKDLAIGSYAVAESHQFMKNDYEFIELNAGHWLIQTNYKDLRDAISRQINSYSDRSS